MAEEKEVCKHLDAITDVKFPVRYECSECVKTGDKWVHLRTCQTCGKTLCCDSSPNKHMTKHAHKLNHPVAISAEPGEHWLWCYIDEQLAKY